MKRVKARNLSKNAVFTLTSAALLSLFIGCMLLFLSSCSGGDSSIPSDTPKILFLGSIAGKVEVPAALTVSPSTLQVISMCGQVKVAPDGTFTVPVFQGGRQFAAVVSASGDPLFVGFLDQTHNTVNARTTAEFLTYVALGGFTLPPDGQQRLLELLAGAPEMDPVAAAISTSLAVNSGSMASLNPAVANALQSAVNQLSGVAPAPKVAAKSLSKVAFDPPQANRSGLILTTVEGANTIRLTNMKRRLTYVMLFQESYIDKNGVTQQGSGPAENGYYELSGVNGLNGVIGTISDMITGNMAWTPVEGPTHVLKLPDEAKSARYRLAVLGPGATQGEWNLRAIERLEYRNTCRKFFVRDVVLPFILNIGLPIYTFSGADGIRKTIEQWDVYQDLANQIYSSPDTVAAIEEDGKINTAVNLALNALVSSNAGQKVLVALLTKAGLTLGGEAAAVEGTVTTVAKVLNAANVANIILSGVDLAGVTADVASAEKGVVWTIDALPATVAVAPTTPEIVVGDKQRITVTIPEISTNGVPNVPVAYQFITTGKYTTLTNDNHSSPGTMFSSSLNWVDINAKEGAEGEDTITCKVYTLDGQTHEYLGKVETTAKVVFNAYTLDNGQGYNGQVDDDLNVYVNGVPVFEDHDNKPLWIPAIHFTAKKDDTLLVTVSDNGGSWGGGPFYLKDKKGRSLFIGPSNGSWGPTYNSTSVVMLSYTTKIPW